MSSNPKVPVQLHKRMAYNQDPATEMIHITAYCCHRQHRAYYMPFHEKFIQNVLTMGDGSLGGVRSVRFPCPLELTEGGVKLKLPL